MSTSTCARNLNGQLNCLIGTFKSLENGNEHHGEIIHAAGHSYEDAIAALNNLQSNAAVIEKARRERSSNAMKNITSTSHYLKLCDIGDSHLKQLNIIHVAGTKGKGSTASFSESILRQHGYKTGFYSSPHLVAARERIRINGIPLSRDAFTYYFWQVYDQLKHKVGDSESHGIPELPPYFMFFTVLALNVFVKEKVDVAIVEVGIGGEYDCTNIIKEPVVVGITSLGIDHTAILGNTIDRIAWQKAGIFKRDVPAFTVEQDEAAMKVLTKRSVEKQCNLSVVPSLSAYTSNGSNSISLGIPGDVQKINASLAIKLCETWLEFKAKNVNNNCQQDSFMLDEKYLEGLAQANWPGRYQTFKSGRITYFLDGAHTAESILTCQKWFHRASKDNSSSIDVIKVLLFNCTGQRNASSLLSPLVQEKFGIAAFSPNNVYVEKFAASDQSNFTVDPEKELENVNILKSTWSNMFNQVHGQAARTEKFACLSDTISWMSNDKELIEKEIHVLVTGSLHLVGGVLGLIDPELSSFQASS